jgi:hypothetical protein
LLSVVVRFAYRNYLHEHPEAAEELREVEEELGGEPDEDGAPT